MHLLLSLCCVQKDLLPVCRELGIGVLAYSPLGRGILTGQLKDLSKLEPTDFRRVNSPWFAQGNMEKVGVLGGALPVWGCESILRMYCPVLRKCAGCAMV